MNQEWYCTSTVIRPDHDCICYFNLRLAQNENLVFHQSSSDATNVYDSMPASALDMIVALQAKFYSKGKPRLMTKPEATPGDRLDLCISGQLEEPQFAEREGDAKAFLISCLMKQVLKSPKISTIFDGLIKHCSQKNAERVNYFPTLPRDSENHAPLNCDLERHEILKIEHSVLNATQASNIRDEAGHFVFVEAFYKALVVMRVWALTEG